MNYLKNGLDLFQKNISETKHLINNFIPYGVGLLVGKPKAGKSTFCLNLCLDICLERHILDYFEYKNTYETLYITYEDNERKLQTVMQELTDHDSNLNRFHYSTQFPTMENNGIETLNNILNNNNKIKVMVVDTLVKFSPKSKQSYSGSYDRLNDLHKIAHEKNIMILLTHHTRKLTQITYDDDFETILGSQGLRGLSDSTYFINGEYLRMEGREIKENTFAIQRDGLRYTIKPYEENLGEIDQSYINFIWNIDRPCTLKEIYENYPDKAKSTIRNRLSKLVADGRLSKPSQGTYEIGPYYDRFYV